ncbi:MULTISPECIES: FAD-dependent monooxygenase [Amycolatopsis]|uniref:4-hydroxybenzoate 3-monooxygenase n=1 Tax=Amycolatopsis dongchuanensis TaxID=1070866 RepID=A0ABP8VMU6_9PSEU
MTRRISTQVGIIGAGPAGLVAAHVLLRAGIDVCVVEKATPDELERRPRAGLLEHRVVRYLREHGLADRLTTEGSRRGWCDFSCAGTRVRVDYAALSGGAAHWVYPQQFLVRDLLTGLEPHFASPALGLRDVVTAPVVECPGLEIACEFVLACDGPRGVGGAALTATGARPSASRYPYDWLTVLATVDSPVAGVTYGIHPRGFAGMMPRAGHTARLYLQTAVGEHPESWSERRVRTEFAHRMADTASLLPSIESIDEVGMLRMRSSVLTPVRHGRLLVAGDAAHVLTPSGAKGMNLAIADAADAAHSLIRWFHDGDRTAVTGYAARRERDAWLTQEFSDWLLHLLHVPPHDATDPDFRLRLKLERVASLSRPGPSATAFAHRYAGSGRHPDVREPLRGQLVAGGAAWR